MPYLPLGLAADPSPEMCCSLRSPPFEIPPFLFHLCYRIVAFSIIFPFQTAHQRSCSGGLGHRFFLLTDRWVEMSLGHNKWARSSTTAGTQRGSFPGPASAALDLGLCLYLIIPPVVGAFLKLLRYQGDRCLVNT